MDCNHPLYKIKRVESSSSLLIVDNVKGKLAPTQHHEFEKYFKCDCGKDWIIDDNLPVFLKEYEERIREDIFKTKVQ